MPKLLGFIGVSTRRIDEQKRLCALGTMLRPGHSTRVETHTLSRSFSLLLRTNPFLRELCAIQLLEQATSTRATKLARFERPSSLTFTPVTALFLARFQQRVATLDAGALLFPTLDETVLRNRRNSGSFSGRRKSHGDSIRCPRSEISPPAARLSSNSGVIISRASYRAAYN